MAWIWVSRLILFILGFFLGMLAATSSYEEHKNLAFDEGVMNKEPLTHQELQGMAGKPVYCADIESYGIVKCETIGTWAGVPFLVGAWHHDGVAVNFEYNIMGQKLKCYKINDN